MKALLMTLALSFLSAQAFAKSKTGNPEKAVCRAVKDLSVIVEVMHQNAKAEAASGVQDLNSKHQLGIAFAAGYDELSKANVKLVQAGHPLIQSYVKECGITPEQDARLKKANGDYCSKVDCSEL